MSIRLKQMLVTLSTMCLVLGAFALAVSPTGAQPLEERELGIGEDIIGRPLGLPRKDIRVTVAQIIRVALGLLGIVAVVIILYAGFRWMTAGGNEEQVGEAKKWIFGAVIGLAIIFSAYAIASFIISQLLKATTSAAP